MNKSVEEIEKEVANAKEKLGIETVEENEVISDEKKIDEDENIITLNDGKVLIFDFDILTGNMIQDLKKKYQTLKKSKASILPEFDDLYYMIVAEKVTGYNYNFFLKLQYKEFDKVKNLVRAYLNEE